MGVDHQKYKKQLLEIRRNGWYLYYIDYNKQTTELIEAAVRDVGYVIKYASPDLITDYIAKIAVNNDSSALRYLPYKFQTEEIIFIAYSNGFHYKYIKSKCEQIIFKTYLRTIGVDDGYLSN